MPPRPKDKKKYPLTMVLYGPSGSGKTSMAAHFPKPGFICDSQEQGIKYLDMCNAVPSPVWVKEFESDKDTVWPKFIETVYKSALDKSIETLVIESLTGFEVVCFLYHCKMKFANNWDGYEGSKGFFQYGAGPESASKLEIPKLLTALNVCRTAGKTIIFTAHSFVKDYNDPTGVTFLKHFPYANKHVWQRIHRWASCVFFMTSTFQEDRTKKTLSKIAKADMDRILFTEGTPTCEAKNWLNVHGTVSMGTSAGAGYKNLMARLP